MERITGDTMQRAEVITRWVVNETQENYRRFNFTQARSHEDEILGIITKYGKPITLREIGQKKNRYKSPAGQELAKTTLDLLFSENRLCRDESPHTNGTVIVKYSLPAN